MTQTQRAKATFAGGCFWCMEGPFETLPGVLEVTAGYAGGDEKNPSYEQVASGKTGHIESIQIIYNSTEIDYEKLLEIFWRQIDPTDPEGQFVDRGKQYTTAIFYHDERQRELAEQSRLALERSGRFKKRIVTPIIPFTTFYPAEDYHQDYHKKNPLHYDLYRLQSGRERPCGSSPGKTSKKKGTESTSNGSKKSLKKISIKIS